MDAFKLVPWIILGTLIIIKVIIIKSKKDGNNQRK